MKTTIPIDWTSHQSIKKAEQQKSRLENRGYILHNTDSSFNRSVLTYVRGA